MSICQSTCLQRRQSFRGARMRATSLASLTVAFWCVLVTSAIGPPCARTGPRSHTAMTGCPDARTLRPCCAALAPVPGWFQPRDSHITSSLRCRVLLRLVRTGSAKLGARDPARMGANVRAPTRTVHLTQMLHRAQPEDTHSARVGATLPSGSTGARSGHRCRQVDTMCI